MVGIKALEKVLASKGKDLTQEELKAAFKEAFKKGPKMFRSEIEYSYKPLKDFAFKEELTSSRTGGVGPLGEPAGIYFAEHPLDVAPLKMGADKDRESVKRTISRLRSVAGSDVGYYPYNVTASPLPGSRIKEFTTEEWLTGGYRWKSFEEITKELKKDYDFVKFPDAVTGHLDLNQWVQLNPQKSIARLNTGDKLKDRLYKVLGLGGATVGTGTAMEEDADASWIKMSQLPKVTRQIQKSLSKDVYDFGGGLSPLTKNSTIVDIMNRKDALKEGLIKSGENKKWLKKDLSKPNKLPPKESVWAGDSLYLYANPEAYENILNATKKGGRIGIKDDPEELRKFEKHAGKRVEREKTFTTRLDKEPIFTNVALYKKLGIPALGVGASLFSPNDAEASPIGELGKASAKILKKGISSASEKLAGMELKGKIIKEVRGGHGSDWRDVVFTDGTSLPMTKDYIHELVKHNQTKIRMADFPENPENKLQTALNSLKHTLQYHSPLTAADANRVPTGGLVGVQANKAKRMLGELGVDKDTHEMCRMLKDDAAKLLPGKMFSQKKYVFFTLRKDAAHYLEEMGVLEVIK